MRPVFASQSASSPLMRFSHSPSTGAGRALSAGNEPITPALHCAITSSGPETMKSGAPTTGSVTRPWMKEGMAMMRPEPVSWDVVFFDGASVA